MTGAEPALGVGALLAVAAGAVAVLLFLIMRLKAHPIIAVVLVSLGTAFATGIDTHDILDVLTQGFADTLGEVGLLLGRAQRRLLLEVTVPILVVKPPQDES